MLRCINDTRQDLHDLYDCTHRDSGNRANIETSGGELL